MPRLRDWIGRPHVARWWSPWQEEDARLGEPDLRRWIAMLDGRPYGYIQDYDPHADLPHHFAHLPPSSRGIDQFVGEESLLGRGRGRGMILARIDALRAEGVPAIGTDPHPHNARAIAVYESLGFKAEGQPRETRWGFVPPMACRNDKRGRMTRPLSRSLAGSLRRRRAAGR